jgi:hypothetical protein
MTIEDQIKLMEGKAEEDILALTSKDRLLYLSNLMEFLRPKIQRSTWEPGTDDVPEITITYE